MVRVAPALLAADYLRIGEDIRTIYRTLKQIAYREEVTTDVHYMSIPGILPGETLPCTVKIRYRHSGQSARIGRMEDGKVRVFFDAPVRAATPGQSAVFYDGDYVIGGGIIKQ